MIQTLLAVAISCGTSPAMQQRAEEINRLAHAGPRMAVLAAGAAPAARFENDILFLPASSLTAPFDDPADLEGLSFRFKRVDASTFTVTREPLQYDETTGPLVVSFGRGAQVQTLPLTQFAFPFGNASYSVLTLSSVRGIHVTSTPALPAKNFDVMDFLTSPTPLIAPLLDFTGSPGGKPDVYVKETIDAVTITWRRQQADVVDFDLQAVLRSNGDIVFSYRLVKNVAWGGPILSTGSTAWLAQRATLLSEIDPAGDVEAVFGAPRDMLDIRSLEVSRIDGTSLLEVRIRTGATINRSVLTPGSSYLVFPGASVNRVELFVYPDKLVYKLPGQSEVVDSAAARIDGADVILYVDEEALSLQERSFRVHASTNAIAVADSFDATLDLGAPCSRRDGFQRRDGAGNLAAACRDVSSANRQRVRRLGVIGRGARLSRGRDRRGRDLHFVPV